MEEQDTEPEEGLGLFYSTKDQDHGAEDTCDGALCTDGEVFGALSPRTVSAGALRYCFHKQALAFRCSILTVV